MGLVLYFLGHCDTGYRYNLDIIIRYVYFCYPALLPLRVGGISWATRILVNYNLKDSIRGSKQIENRFKKNLGGKWVPDGHSQGETAL